MTDQAYVMVLFLAAVNSLLGRTKVDGLYNALSNTLKLYFYSFSRYSSVSTRGRNALNASFCRQDCLFLASSMAYRAYDATSSTTSYSLYRNHSYYSRGMPCILSHSVLTVKLYFAVISVGIYSL